MPWLLGGHKWPLIGPFSGRRGRRRRRFIHSRFAILAVYIWLPRVLVLSDALGRRPVVMPASWLVQRTRRGCRSCRGVGLGCVAGGKVWVIFIRFVFHAMLREPLQVISTCVTGLMMVLCLFPRPVPPLIAQIAPARSRAVFVFRILHLHRRLELWLCPPLGSTTTLGPLPIVRRSC